MELYKVGKVVSVGKTYLIFEHNFCGHIVYVARTEKWEKNDDKYIKIYLYKFTSEFSESLYGFKTFNERVLFEDLVSVTGVGPKTALSLLKEGEDVVCQLIAEANVSALASLPHIGPKTANQIAFELKEKYVRFQAKRKNANIKIMPIEIKPSLKTLGFTAKQIDFALSKMAPGENIEMMVESAIKLISNEKFA